MRSRKVSGGKKKPFTANWVNRNIQRIWKNLCAQGDKAGNREKKEKKKKKHESIMEISARSQEHFQKSLSMNTVQCAVHEHGLEL